MRLRCVLAALVLVSTVVGCGRKKAAKLTEDTFTLANGLRVELVSGPCGDGADLVVLHEVGTDHDPAARSGLVHVLAGATGMVDAPDHLVAARTVGAGELDRALDEAAAALGGFAVAPAEVERARAAVLAEIAGRSGGDAALSAATYAAEAVRPSAGDGRRGGLAAEVEALTAGEIEAFARAHLGAGGTRLVVVGRFDARAVRARIEAAFGARPAGTTAVSRPPVQASVTGTLVMGRTPAALSLAVPAPSVSAPQFPAFLILAARAAEVGGEYDPLADARMLMVRGAFAAGEPPDPAAARMRQDLGAALARPLTAADRGATRARFAGLFAVDAAACRKDRRTFALGRARRAQLGLDAASLTRALAGTTDAQLAEAAALFDAKHTAAVVAGGPVQ